MKNSLSSLDVSEMIVSRISTIYLDNALFEFLFVVLNQKLELRFCESFIYNKKRCYSSPFLQVLLTLAE